MTWMAAFRRRSFSDAMFILQGVKGAEQEDPGLQTGDESGAALLI
ncbi:MAG: hypothetical protein PWQ46_1391 [Methanomicrobiaceae archaeon]|nr:hypothetical protein [Methanomicrobiaceae archaeon]